MSDHALTINDGRLLPAILRALAPVIRFACHADVGNTSENWAEALDQLHAARRAVAAAGVIEGAYRDRLKQALVPLEDYSRAIAIVLAREAETDDGGGPALETARRARDLARLAGEIAGALGALAQA